VASDGTTRCVIPNGTVIPTEGHYLCANSSVGGYSLGGYPAGNGTTATPDATYTSDIPNNTGLALFRTTIAANFNAANRLDSVGPSSEANPLYKEGTGYAPITTGLTTEYSYFRLRSKTDGRVFDREDNATDFFLADTAATNLNGFPNLGAPGPENLSSPLFRSDSQMIPSLVAPCVSGSTAPNRVRTGSPGGFLDIRKRITNNTGANVTRLRFRIIDITTSPAPVGFADLRVLTSSGSTEDDPCNPGELIDIAGLTLETPPSQPVGGGFNSTLSAGTITLETPLAANSSITVNFLLGVQQTGRFRFFVNVEALP